MVRNTTVERWFYQHAPTLLPASNPTVVCVDEFAFRKGRDLYHILT
jgi:transposase